MAWEDVEDVLNNAYYNENDLIFLLQEENILQGDRISVHDANRKLPKRIPWGALDSRTGEHP
jgi:hypothetical protein